MEKLICSHCGGEFVVPRTLIEMGKGGGGNRILDYSMVRCLDCQRVTYTEHGSPGDAGPIKLKVRAKAATR